MISGKTMTEPDYLAALSHEQLDAATHPSNEPLQILAGPGSGKTRVLVSRVAWLVLEQKINPRDLVVVTFTNKAAKEMRQRLVKLIGHHRTDLLVLGTFHATCAKFLRKYASLVGFSNNFSICDADETKRIIKELIKQSVAEKDVATGYETLRPETCIAEISRAKATGQTPESYLATLLNINTPAKVQSRKIPSTSLRRSISHVFRKYAEHLRRNNALDFDDLLLYGVQLFRENTRIIAHVRHVLVDEFQDTNRIQYDLMATLAGGAGSRGAVSIVGDPDQSIYGWRSAEAENLDKMASEFAQWSPSNTVTRLFLEQNYRSSGSILSAARGIISSSSSRIERGLFTCHSMGSKVVLCRLTNSQEEASYIATEIRRLVAMAAGLVTYNDIAILLRYNALSREVEQQLLRENIPSRVMGGARYFDRKEVKDLLAYMLLADNPHFIPAFNRIVNVPKRSIGDKSLRDLHVLAESQGRHVSDILAQIAQSDAPITGVKEGLRKSLRGFCLVIEEIRTMSTQHCSVANIIRRVIELIDYESYLRKESDFEQRWENVQELINFSALVAKDESVARSEDPVAALRADVASDQRPPLRGATLDDAIALDDSPSPQVKPRLLAEKIDNLEEGAHDDEEESPLRTFLEACTLSTDLEGNIDDDSNMPRVTIATTHAAKGLEFPVVFVLSVEEGTYPFHRSSDTKEEVDEEARLLYVATTRAQVQLYLTYCSTRLVHGQEMDKNLSRFVSRLADSSTYHEGRWTNASQPTAGAGRDEGKVEKVAFTPFRPTLDERDCKTFASVLGRREIPLDVREEMVRDYEQGRIAVRIRSMDERIKRAHISAPIPSKDKKTTSNLFASREISDEAKNEPQIRMASSLISKINEESHRESQSLGGSMGRTLGLFSGFSSFAGGKTSRSASGSAPSTHQNTSSLTRDVGTSAANVRPLHEVPRSLNRSAKASSKGKRLGTGHAPSNVLKKMKYD